MKNLIIAITFMAVLFLCPVCSRALYIGSELVQDGEYTFEVLGKCGEPEYRELIQLGIKHPKIEHWMYEENGYFYLLIFKSGKLDEIKTIRK